MNGGLEAAEVTKREVDSERDGSTKHGHKDN